ncbi:MAG: adenosylcobinamide kinase / adenosylcobinamide-phosphate guanylyltransferase [Mycobacterium sp.]|jgi:adenosylcobinamide kinase/adenosylcobinamide-phosphate guanylyltransferase|nr:adenosyl cobinamide kinase/adenosyl cobinamide phosphate guanylyltransferase [Mycobacterium sp.]MDT5134929.1 adenosylcobinamide kinase / adenosylcobinamide-phosphate guanylyltransferase [Mycobacterium sp.]
MRTLVLGGIRSGKSAWAELAIAEEVGPPEPVRYLATGSCPDDDPSWSQRVADHRARRPQYWSTDETIELTAQLRQIPAPPTLIDDLGGWLTAVLDRRGWDSPVRADVDELIDAVYAFGSPLVVVSPEAGLMVVPATGSGRRFVDEIGELNQRMAGLCDRVVLVVAGQALTIKDYDE